MGQAPSREFQAYVLPNSAVPATESTLGCSSIYRSKLSESGLITTHDPEILTLYDNFRRSVTLYPDRDCLGTRSYNPDGSRGPYAFESYRAVNKRAENVASGLVNAGFPQGSHIGIYAINRAEWIITELACYTQNLITISLYDTLGPDAVAYIINQAQIPIVVCSKDKVTKLLEVAHQCPSLKTIVQMEKDGDAALQAAAEEKNVKLISFLDLENNGAWKPLAPNPPKPDDMATIMYTSGTTGNPKGVLITHRNQVAELSALKLHIRDVDVNETDCYISYLPLAHIMERIVAHMVFSLGAGCGFYQGDVLKLFDDIQALRPSIFPSVPRLFNRLYDKVNATVAQAGGMKKIMFDWGYATKKGQLLNSQSPQNAFWDSVVFQKMKEKLGGRCKLIVTGSAPISDEVYRFLQICFGCAVIQGYGLTETCSAVALTNVDDFSCGHNGPPVASLEVRLEDVPEMNYFTGKDTVPRGEVCVRGPALFSGYYLEPEKTKEVIDAEGWFHTGDIGQFNEDGTLSIIDRKKNIFKLAQGEYVAAEFLEGVFQKARLVSQIFVYGDSLQSFLVAVVVPDHETLIPWARSQGLLGADAGDSAPQDTVARLVQLPEVKKAVLADLTSVGKDAKLRGFEFIKAVALESQPFTVESNLLTPSFKIRRADMKKKYQGEIDALYAQLNAAQGTK